MGRSDNQPVNQTTHASLLSFLWNIADDVLRMERGISNLRPRCGFCMQTVHRSWTRQGSWPSALKGQWRRACVITKRPNLKRPKSPQSKRISSKELRLGLFPARVLLCPCIPFMAYCCCLCSLPEPRTHPGSVCRLPSGWSW